MGDWVEARRRGAPSVGGLSAHLTDLGKKENLPTVLCACRNSALFVEAAFRFSEAAFRFSTPRR